MKPEDKQQRSSLDLLADMRRHHDWAANRRIALALAGLGERAVPDLVLALQDPDGYVRNGAAIALGKIGNKAAAGPLLDLMRFRDQRQYEDDEDREARCNAVAALGEIGDTSVSEALLSELQKLVGDDSTLACEILDTLEKIGATIPVPMLMNLLEVSDLDLPKYARAFLGKMGSEVVTLLMGFIEDKSRQGRSYAIDALARIGDPRCVPMLMRVLRDHSDDELVRGCAAEALGRCGDSQEAFLLLCQTLENARERSIVRGQALRGLGLLRAPGTFDVLAGYLDDQSLKYTSLMALGDLGDRRACRPLLRILREGDGSARLWAARSLGSIGCEEALPALLEIRDSIDEKSLLGAHSISTFKMAIEKIRNRTQSTDS